MAKESKKQAILCSQCGGPIQLIDEDQELVTCPYCGTVHQVADLLGDSDQVRIEKLRAKTMETLAANRHALQKDKLRVEALRQEAALHRVKRRNFMRGWTSILFTIFVVCCMILIPYGFMEGLNLVGVICTVQSILGLVALMIGWEAIPMKKKRLRIILTTLTLLLIIPFVFAANMTPEDEKDQPIVWEGLYLGSKIPEIPNAVGKVSYDDEESLSMFVSNMDRDAYKAYLEQCKTMGFDRSVRQTSMGLQCFNEEGYCLELEHFTYTDVLSLSLESPIPLEVLSWPEGPLGEKIPRPQSELGSIDYVYERDFVIYVGDMDLTAYNAYVEEVLGQGYDVNVYRGEDSCTGHNEFGSSVRIDYQGNNIVLIDLSISPDEAME